MLLNKDEILKIIKFFPKVRPEVVELIHNMIQDQLYDGKRLPGMKKEFLEMTGLCSVISNKIFDLLKDAYPGMKVVSGFFKIDRHPRKSGLIGDIHTWLELDNRILDFTAKQFEPFSNSKIDDIVITSIDDPRYFKNKPVDMEMVSLDPDYIMDHYISNL
jgi:hypothetical protein